MITRLRVVYSEKLYKKPKRLVSRRSKMKWVKPGMLMGLCVLIGLSVWAIGFKRETHAIETAAMVSPLDGMIVVIDAGHGDPDGGVVSPNGVREDELNLAVAKALKERLKGAGALVVMTRTDENGLGDTKGSLRERKNQDMNRRREIVELSKGQLLVSIHMNQFSEAKYWGFQVFYQKESEEGKRLAEFVQQSYRENVNKENKRQAQAEDFFMLKGDMASILVECGFLSNAAEEKKLCDEGYQKELAFAIHEGILRFLAAE